MPFQENVSNFVQYTVIGHKDGVLLVSSLFIVTFFSLLFLLTFFYSLMFFCSYGTAENKYLKVPHSRDDVVVEFKMQFTLRYGVTCVAVTSELGNNKSC